MIDHDRLFKKLLTTFFREFMEAFFPEAHQYINYSHLEFLSEELFTDVTMGEKKYIDILVKTRLQNEEGFVLIHVEPQAYKEADFNRRMFNYFARLHQKYNMKVLPVAVLAHNIKKAEPDTYEVEFPFFEVLRFRFMQLHLKRLSWKEYLQKDNPAVAALLSRMNYGKEERLKMKLEFFRMLMRMRLDPARMQLLVGFFETYVQLTSGEEELFNIELVKELQLEEVKKMAEILTSWHKRGIEEGWANSICKLMNKKFGTDASVYYDAIKKITDENELDKIFDTVFKAESIDEVRIAIEKIND